MTKIAGSYSNPDPLVRGMYPVDPDPPQNVMDPEHCFHDIQYEVVRLKVNNIF
jgi:hypothetical protein